MHQPKFVFKGKEYPVTTIDFLESGKLVNVSFIYQGKLVTAFSITSMDKEGFDEDGLFHANLYDCLKLEN
ncbi:hypothetical protein [Bacillus sp. FJAT-22090]|uniref:hypothetical protein n=1 Tax=Bacillus sp. FJAT-22090 TaxID=1581038 RepID=UPI0011A3EB29|nr:hypothetical protein [Bacillus sp. FJAT-22090]